MPGTSDVIYLYDGSFEGLLCCVHESVYTHELPVDIQPEEAAQPTLFRQKYIAADEEKAARVSDFLTTTGLWPRPSRRKTMCSPF